MAKKRDIDVSGMSLADIINLDPIHLKGISEKSMAKLTSRLVSAYNKRAKRLENSGLSSFSPAYIKLKKSNQTRLSVKGKSYNDLFSTFAQAKRLLTERKTFSIAGTKKVIADLEKRLKVKFRSAEEGKRFWEAIDKLKENRIGLGKKVSDDVQIKVADMMVKKNKTIDEVLADYGVVIDQEAPDTQEETAEMMGEEKKPTQVNGFELEGDELDE